MQNNKTKERLEFMNKGSIIAFFRTSNFLVVLLIVLFLSDLLTKVCFYGRCDFYNYSAVSRGLFFFLSLIITFTSITKFRKRVLLFLIILCLFFILGQFFFKPIGVQEGFFQNFIFLSRYLFIFSIVIFYDGLPKMPVNNNVLITFEWIIIINSVAILLGFLFDFEMFRTYRGGRFGYNGFLFVASIATFFYAIALSYLAFRIKQNRKKYIPFFVFILFISTLVGTKALLLFVVLTIGHVFLFYKLYLNRLFYLGISLIGIIGVVFYEKIIGVLKNNFEVLVNVYQEYGLITMLTSFRNINIKTDLIEMTEKHWGIFNYFIGGTDFTKYRVEFDFIDVFLFFGVIGGLLYLIFYFRHIVVFNMLNGFGKVQIALLLIIALMSGTFFNNPPVAIFVCLLLYIMNKKNYEKSS